MIKMTDLRSIAEELGFAEARTYVASGNLLFKSGASEEFIRNALEDRLKEKMAKDVDVILRTSRDMDSVLRANPFPKFPPASVQVFFLRAAPPADILDTIKNKEDERVVVGPREVYVAYGEKGIGRSRLRVPAAEAGTARNMNTVAKLAELAREMS
jgi:uncharacterized protein (DUF1697 family)